MVSCVCWGGGGGNQSWCVFHRSKEVTPLELVLVGSPFGRNHLMMKLDLT